MDAIVKEDVDGVACFEAEWLIDGVKHEVVVTRDGARVLIEKAVPASAVPANVVAMAQKHFPIGTKIEFEERLVVHYEAEAVVDGKVVEVLMAATGAIVESPKSSRSAEVGDADDDDDDTPDRETARDED